MFRPHDLSGPIRGQLSGHVICLDKSEARIIGKNVRKQSCYAFFKSVTAVIQSVSCRGKSYKQVYFEDTLDNRYVLEQVLEFNSVNSVTIEFILRELKRAQIYT